MKKAFKIIKNIIKIGVIIFGIFALIIISSLFIDNDDDLQKDETVKIENSKEDKNNEFSQNEIVNYNDVEYSITNVTKTNGTEYDKPKEGCEFVIVSIKIENKSNEKISYNPYDWKMENSQGYEEDNTFSMIDINTSLQDGNLNPNGVKEGTIVFEQPIEDSSLKLNYYDNIFLTDDASFKISID